MNIDGLRIAEEPVRDEQDGKMIYRLIGEAIGKIGAIGKNRKNQQQGFMYRGIDQVYNALNPVMAELGIFFVPEVLDMKRDERTNKNGTVLTYTILTMKYTAYAPDGSSVSMTVMGEGMDSGDKGCNKAMSVAMKYAMFQLFCIPTEEMKDPDADVYEVMLKGANVRPQNAAQQASVTKADTMPAPQPQAAKPAENAPINRIAKGPEPAAYETPGAYIRRRVNEITPFMMDGFNFVNARKSLISGGAIEDIPSAVMTMDQARNLIAAIEKNFSKPEE